MDRRPRRAAYVVASAAIGALLGDRAMRHPEWVATHLGTIALGLLAATALAIVLIQRHMDAFERGHDARAESFRLAMLAQFAPELLDREQGAVPMARPRLALVRD